jgi:type 1 fimbriae regulatory protein FimB/type 1 fimbriae regulatory protein FimE
MGEIVTLPTIEIRTVARQASRRSIGGRMPPGRKSNAEHGRTREWLSEAEIEKLMAAAADGRYGHRDATLILLAYRHALRVSELVWLRWSQLDLKGARIAVVRAKKGIPSVHPLTGRELRALRRLQRDQVPGTEFLFMSERGAPMAPAAAQKVVREAGKRAKMPFPVHIHMLRHSCGYALINRGSDVRTVQAYMGHASISNTVIYTRLDAARFNGLWHD